MLQSYKTTSIARGRYPASGQVCPPRLCGIASRCYTCQDAWIGGSPLNSFSQVTFAGKLSW